jgi:exopolysaccharide biosynthesis protein
MMNSKLAMQGNIRQVLLVTIVIHLCLSLAGKHLLGTQTNFEKSSHSIPPGIQYTHKQVKEDPWSIHIARINRSDPNFQFTSTLAQGSVYGLSSVARQVAALPKTLGCPVVAVNADFFRIRPGPYQGDPLGLHIAVGRLVSSPIGASFWIDSTGGPRLSEVYCRFRATGPDDFDIPFQLNQPREDDKAVLYTPMIGDSTRTKAGRELILKNIDGSPWLPLKPSRRYTSRITDIRESGNTLLESDTMVLSIGPELLQRIDLPAKGTVISLSTRTSPDLEGVAMAIGGGPILINDGKTRSWSPSQPRHPRTVIGWNKNYFYLVVVDGRQPNLSIGMTYPELADLMLSLGCTEAMNLDGGGSSTFYLAGKIMNSPSDGRPRSVANALIVLDKRTGSVKY